MIQPSIGRVVWYTPIPGEIIAHDGIQPLAAIICYVWSDRMVNLAVFNSNGKAYNFASVQLLQDDDVSHGSGYAQWMPYQIGQAKKAE